jgi:hypothetical protein
MYFIFPTKLKRQKLFLHNLSIIRLIAGIFIFLTFYLGAYNDTFGITPNSFFRILNNSVLYILLIDIFLNLIITLYFFLPDYITNKKQLIRISNIVFLFYNLLFAVLLFVMVLLYFSVVNHKEEAINNNSRDNYMFLTIISSSFAAFNTYYFYFYYSGIKKIMFSKKSKTKNKEVNMFIDDNNDEDYIKKIRDIFSPDFDNDISANENEINIKIKSIQKILNPESKSDISSIIKEGIDISDVSEMKSKLERKKNKRKKTKTLEFSDESNTLEIYNPQKTMNLEPEKDIQIDLNKVSDEEDNIKQKESIDAEEN